MNRLQNPNMAILTLAMEKLGSLSNEMVIVGGCATGLLITDKAAAPIRATIDVDVIVQVVTRGDYYKLSERLRKKGFNEDMSEDSPICRWICGEIILDVMPTDKSVLGFGNQWYEQAAINAFSFDLEIGKSIKIISAPYFLMTKLDAFDGRGKGDYMMSHDIEDIVAVLDGRETIFSEILDSDDKLKIALKAKFTSLLADPTFSESVSGHVLGDNVSQQRVPMILELILKITEL
ncbi:MAG: hypothetical protein COB38_12100 [Gammaproteobacteria bacterium]|nr:MAG: hypothetical protein COB38_12100 [Gammaproteobacteria bacterium]